MPGASPTSRRRISLATTALIPLAAVALAPVAQARDVALSPQARTPQLVEEFFAPGVRRKPGTIVGGDSFGFSDLVWSSWNRNAARATGTRNALDFSTGTERVVSVPVRVRLSRPRACGPYRLFTRAVAVRTDGEPLPERIANVGCRIAMPAYEEGVAEPSVIDYGAKPASIDRAPSPSLRNLRWRRWSRPVARARGRTGSDAVRIVASNAGFCRQINALAYRTVRVTVGTGANRYSYTQRFARNCADAQ